MGKPVVRHPCLRCGKKFNTKPKKQNVIKKGKVIGHTWEVEQYCQSCRNKQEKQRQLVKKIRNESRVRVTAEKVDLKAEVRDLIWAEHKYPDLVKKLRGED